MSPAIPRTMWPKFAAWAATSVPQLNRAIIERAIRDIGICEIPPGSNRSPRIDNYVKASGSPLGSYWCACWATAMWEDCGAKLPPHSRGSCDVLRDFAESEGLWHQTPIEGALVIYGRKDTDGSWKLLENGKPDAAHVGIIIRALPYLISLEGNAAWSGYSTNGQAVVCKKVEMDRVLGYIHPASDKPETLGDPEE